jgi:hypothetical protein
VGASGYWQFGIFSSTATTLAMSEESMQECIFCEETYDEDDLTLPRVSHPSSSSHGSLLIPKD